MVDGQRRGFARRTPDAIPDLLAREANGMLDQPQTRERLRLWLRRGGLRDRIATEGVTVAELAARRGLSVR